ncbi:MAG: exonuclease SbcCD subunit D [Treponema sp.]|jgi:exonuclease SbcD|nr:exonuclease SbcCD subunit D [Treponema sp.]
MRFLHTADLHLGKIFHEHSLIEDQRFMLDQLIENLADLSYRALIIAGDVYDRSIPSPDGVDLFGSFLGKLKARRPDLAVLILSGNHDSSSRLGFGKELFAELGIHFSTDPAKADKPVMVRDGNTRDSCAFFLLPYMNPGSLCSELTGPAEEGGKTAEPIRSQARLAEEAAARLEKGREEALAVGVKHTVLAAHLFARGGVESESERVFLGGAEQVDTKHFGGFDYLALGHLHQRQKAGERAWYSGSPLPYSFNEASPEQEKCFLSVELKEDNSLTVEPLPVRPLRRLRKLRGSFNYFYRESAGDPEISKAEKDYIEIHLTDQGLVENPLPLLRQRFPWILSIRQEAALSRLREGVPREEGAAGAVRERRTTVEDFEDFLTGIYGAPDNEKIALFRELLEEAERGEAET